MYIKLLSTVFLLLVSAQLKAQLFIGVEGNTGIYKEAFGSLSFGKQFKSGLTLRWMGAYGNFGKETSEDKKPPYSGITESDFSAITKFSSSNVGISTGLGVGYSFRFNDKHCIHMEAVGQIYLVKDMLKMDYVTYWGPYTGHTWSRKEEHQHSNSSVGIGVSHHIRLNHFLSVYYGVRVNDFFPNRSVLLGNPTGYYPTEGNVMCGFEPNFHAGLRFDLVKKAK